MGLPKNPSNTFVILYNFPISISRADVEGDFNWSPLFWMLYGPFVNFHKKCCTESRLPTPASAGFGKVLASAIEDSIIDSVTY